MDSTWPNLSEGSLCCTVEYTKHFQIWESPVYCHCQDYYIHFYIRHEHYLHEMLKFFSLKCSNYYLGCRPIASGTASTATDVPLFLVIAIKGGCFGEKNALGAPSHYSSSDTYSQTNVDTLWHLIIKSVPHRTKMKVSSMLLFVHVFTSLRNVIHKHHHSTRYTGKINIMSLLPSVLLECTAMRMATNEWFIIQTYCTFKHSICDL